MLEVKETKWLRYVLVGDYIQHKNRVLENPELITLQSSGLTHLSFTSGQQLNINIFSSSMEPQKAT
jgi:hypothetical protein